MPDPIDNTTAYLTAILDPDLNTRLTDTIEAAFFLDRPPYMGELLRQPREQHGMLLGAAFSMEPGPDENELSAVLRELQDSGGYERVEALMVMAEAIAIWEEEVDRLEAASVSDEGPAWCADQQAQAFEALIAEGAERVANGEDHSMVAAEVAQLMIAKGIPTL